MANRACYKIHFTSNKENGEIGVLSESLVELYAGSLAGAAQIVIAQPFDTAKVKLQAFPYVYKNMCDCLMRTYRDEGIIRGLYAGSVPALFCNVGENAIILAAYERCRKFVATYYSLQSTEELPIAGEALAGGLSTFFSAFIVCPTELVKCRMQAMKDVRLFAIANNKPQPALLPLAGLIRSIYSEQGVSGFYRGLAATFLRDIPGYACFFGVYEALKECFKKPGENRADVGPWVTMLAAGVGSIFLWIVSFPADVIKTRIQINNLSWSTIAVGKHIVCKEGVKALYSGLMPTLIQTMPATVTLFLVYEYTKKKLNIVFNPKQT